MAILLILTSTQTLSAADEFSPKLTPDKELLAKIAELPENTWLKLPPLKVAGEIAWCSQANYNAHNMVKFGPTLRGYSNRMVWAPDRKRALYCDANHQSPHFLNDVWEYDLASNTWFCLSPPDTHFNASEAWVKANVLVKDGFVTTKRGGPVRPCHTWDALCYDPERRRLLWLDPARGLIFGSWDKVVKGLGADLKPDDAKLAPAPWIFEFDPAARKWDKAWSGPDAGEGAILAYLPDLKTLWVKGGTRPCGTKIYEPETKTWKPLSSKGMPGYGAIGAYSPDHRLILVVDIDKTWTYSLTSNEWKLVQPKAPTGARDATGVVCYDSVARKFVLATTAGPSPGLWLYDPDTNEWSSPKTLGDAWPGSSGGYYDPERKVFVSYTSRDMYVYRCRKAG